MRLMHVLFHKNDKKYSDKTALYYGITRYALLLHAFLLNGGLCALFFSVNASNSDKASFTACDVGKAFATAGSSSTNDVPLTTSA